MPKENFYQKVELLKGFLLVEEKEIKNEEWGEDKKVDLFVVNGGTSDFKIGDKVFTEGFASQEVDNNVYLIKEDIIYGVIRKKNVKI